MWDIGVSDIIGGNNEYMPHHIAATEVNDVTTSLDRASTTLIIQHRRVLYRSKPLHWDLNRSEIRSRTFRNSGRGMRRTIRLVLDTWVAEFRTFASESRRTHRNWFGVVGIGSGGLKEAFGAFGVGLSVVFNILYFSYFRDFRTQTHWGHITVFWGYLFSCQNWYLYSEGTPPCSKNTLILRASSLNQSVLSYSQCTLVIRGFLFTQVQPL